MLETSSFSKWSCATAYGESERAVVTKRELSNTAELSVFKIGLFSYSRIYGHGSWVMTRPQLQGDPGTVSHKFYVPPKFRCSPKNWF